MSVPLPPVPGGIVGPVNSSAAAGAVNSSVSSVTGAIAQSFSSAAAWVLNEVGSVITSSTSVDLSARWFSSHYETMALLAALVVAPLAAVTVVQAVVRQDLSLLVRCLLVNLPMSLLAMGIAVELTQLGLAAVDQMCTAVTAGTHADLTGLFTNMERWFEQGSATGPALPGVVVLVVGCMVVFGGISIWLEMALRTASIYLAVLFLPMSLAATVMPATIPWCRRMVETLAALVFSKLVVVAALSLALSAGGDPSAGFGDVVEGCALLLMAAFAPFALLRLIPVVEAGAVHHLEGLSRRASSAPAHLSAAVTGGVDSLLAVPTAIRSAVDSVTGGTQVLAAEAGSSPTRIPLAAGDRGDPAAEKRLSGGRPAGAPAGEDATTS